MKALAAERWGYTKMEGGTTQSLPLVFHEGDLHEGDVIERMRKEGWKIERQQEEVVLQLSGLVRVVGHIDGVGIAEKDGAGGMEGVRKGEEMLVEVKSMGKEEWEKWMKMKWETPGLVQKYKWQLSCYMIALGKRGVLAVKNRNSGQISYTLLSEPFYPVTKIRTRLNSIEQSSADTLPDCDVVDWWCKYKYLHDEEEVGIEVEEDKKLEKLCRAYDKARADEMKARGMKDGLGIEIREYLKDKVKVEMGEYRVERKMVGRKKLLREEVDWVLMKEHKCLGDFEVTEYSERLTVERKKDGLGE